MGLGSAISAAMHILVAFLEDLSATTPPPETSDDLTTQWAKLPLVKRWYEMDGLGGIVRVELRGYAGRENGFLVKITTPVAGVLG